MDPFHLNNFFHLVNFIVRAAGLYLAINALFQSRTPQGALAWFVGLLGFPYFAIPLFIVFGRRRYHERPHLEPSFKFPQTQVIQHRKESLAEFEKFLRHTGSGFTPDNAIELLVDSDKIYKSMLEEIENAKEYIILQVYIFRTDETGKMFASALSAMARSGVKVYLLYEKVLIRMSKEVLKEMQDAGIHLGMFNPFKRNKWHLNFRNHRKMLVVDGRVGFFGGINIGDDYVGKYPHIGAWRDTNVRICGPSLSRAQYTFAKDWLVSQRVEVDINWKIIPCEGNANVLIFSSGPEEERPLCLLHHIAMVDLSRKRLWIANPYIVPPQSLTDALYMAALRGVDVRILVPQKNDNPLIVAVSDIYYERLISYGVRIFSYEKGFLHQKAMLIDDILGVVGSANFDFRSMYINFEVTTTSSDPGFINDMEKMLLDDFSVARELHLQDFKDKSIFKKVLERGVNLLAPVL